MCVCVRERDCVYVSESRRGLDLGGAHPAPAVVDEAGPHVGDHVDDELKGEDVGEGEVQLQSLPISHSLSLSLLNPLLSLSLS